MSGFRMRNTIDAPFVDEYANTRSIENLPIYRPGAPGNGDTLIFNTATNMWGYGPGGSGGGTGVTGPTGPNITGPDRFDAFVSPAHVTADHGTPIYSTVEAALTAGAQNTNFLTCTG